MERIWILDWDDTLIYNEYMYVSPQAEFLEFMLRKLNAPKELFDEAGKLRKIVEEKGKRCKDLGSIISENRMNPLFGEIISTALEISLEDMKANPHNPFEKRRFPDSLSKAYFSLCRKYGKEAYEKEASHLYAVGERFSDVKREWIEGAEETLQFLKGKKDELLLFTAGDEELQRRKIEVNDARRYFDKCSIFIVPSKEDGRISSIIDPRRKQETYMVGNSIRSDINPAIKAGINAVYIPFDSWLYETNHSGIADNGKVRIFDRIGQIIENYDSL